MDSPDARSDSGAGPETSPQDESIQKLRIANQALRQQLKEFSRALDASLAQNQDLSDASTKASSSAARRRDMVAALSAKEKQLKAVHKKLEIYKRANVELKKQLGSAYHPEKLAQLKNEKREKERIIEQLQQENKTLLIVQRNQSKRIEEQENLKSEWPTRVSSLMADLRVAKDKLRRAKEREQKVEGDSKKLHEQMVRLQAKNKNLQSQLSAYEKKGGHGAGDKAKRRLVNEWRAEKDKLQHSIEVLERSKQQERTKGERLLRANMAELQKVKKEMERHKQQLDEKEKEIRLQVLQVKKLRRQLRELALGGGGNGSARGGWEGDASRSDYPDPSSSGGHSLRGDAHGRSAHSLDPIGRSSNATGDDADVGAGRRGGGRSERGLSGGHGERAGGRGVRKSGSNRQLRKKKSGRTPGGRKRGRGGRAAGGAHGSNHGSMGKKSRSRKKLAEHKQDAAELEEQHRAASTIQTRYKTHRKVQGERREAAVKVQRLYRDHSERRVGAQRDQAATKLQASYRGHRVRKKKKAKRGPMTQDAAATTIQRSVRARQSGHRGKKSHRSRSPSHQQLNDGAVAVQSVYRGHQGRKRFAKEKRRKEDAAVTIQSLGRGRLGRIEARRVRGERQRERARRFASGKNLRG